MKTNKCRIAALTISVIFFLFTSCGNSSAGKNAGAKDKGEVKRYGYRVVNEYPHSVKSYTQGLYWNDGYLWEGTGQNGQSALLKLELETGRELERRDLPREFFGEGIALLDGSIYQLTWNSGVGLIYDAVSLEETGRFRYPGEGWGLTTDGQVLYMSDGTDKLYKVDPSDFNKGTSVSVRLDGRRVFFINELEWINGKVWANVYMTDSIIIIDPETGNVEGVIDLTGILPAERYAAGTDVLNGIAYDPVEDRIFVTGKNWPVLFEIELVEKNSE